MFPTYGVILSSLRGSRPIESRFGPAREVIGAGAFFDAGEFPVRSGQNVRIGIQEGLQLIAGVYDPEAIKLVAPNAQHDLFTLQMAYGPRVAHLVPKLLDELRRNPDSRQAVIFLGNNEQSCTNDLPCTESVQFLVREAELRTVVHMRSWDAVKGMPYDAIMMGMLAQAVAHCLGIRCGQTRFHAGSLHLYDSDNGVEARPHTARVHLPPELKREWSTIQTWAKTQVRLTSYWMASPGRMPAGVRTSTIRGTEMGEGQGIAG